VAYLREDDRIRKLAPHTTDHARACGTANMVESIATASSADFEFPARLLLNLTLEGTVTCNCPSAVAMSAFASLAASNARATLSKGPAVTAVHPRLLRKPEWRETTTKPFADVANLGRTGQGESLDLADPDVPCGPANVDASNDAAVPEELQIELATQDETAAALKLTSLQCGAPVADTGMAGGTEAEVTEGPAEAATTQGCRVAMEFGTFEPTVRGVMVTVSTHRWSDFLNRVRWEARVLAVPEAAASAEAAAVESAWRLPEVPLGAGTTAPVVAAFNGEGTAAAPPRPPAARPPASVLDVQGAAGGGAARGSQSAWAFAKGQFLPSRAAVLRGQAPNTVELALVPTVLTAQDTSNSSGAVASDGSSVLVAGFTLQVAGTSLGSVVSRDSFWGTLASNEPAAAVRIVVSKPTYLMRVSLQQRQGLCSCTRMMRWIP